MGERLGREERFKRGEVSLAKGYQVGTPVRVIKQLFGLDTGDGLYCRRKVVARRAAFQRYSGRQRLVFRFEVLLEIVQRGYARRVEAASQRHDHVKLFLDPTVGEPRKLDLELVCSPP